VWTGLNLAYTARRLPYDSPVDEIVLFMSELSRAGPTYTALGRATLAGRA